MEKLRWYTEGAYEQVWTELVAAGSELRRDPDLWQEATTVAAETMRRLRHNVELLHQRLPELGYQFAEPAKAYVPPPAHAVAQLDELEARIGTLPLALRVFFETVGSVDFTGQHPDWSHPYPDPLVVDAPVEYILSEHEWHAKEGHITPENPFLVEFAPDYLHKADVSGGAPYGIAVPSGGVDSLVAGEVHQTTFVNYLRIACRWAGFPGWKRRTHGANERLSFPEPLKELASELTPL